MMERYRKENLRDLLPLPAADANKYSRGKLTLFAGSASYPGAAVLAARSAQRSGAGYTELVTEASTVPFIQAQNPSLIVRSGGDVYESDLVVSCPQRPSAFVVGPGFDAGDDETSTITFFVLSKTKAPILVDGGALISLGTSAGNALCKKRFVDGFPTILTPHAGEASRLAKPFDLPCDDPAQLAYFLSLSYGAITVLKGPETFISDGEEILAIKSGTPALAKAGTGDVLSGIIGAFLAQGADPLDAAVLGVTLHAKAGCLAAEALTVVSVMAEDVLECIPLAIEDLLSPR